jgi:PTH1 family peptidyl-tRNA hydrolase
MWFIVGLGNPGEEYENTRHNLGFMALDILSERWRIPVQAAGPNKASGRGRRKGREILLLKPLSYMNRSGEVVGPIVRKEWIPANRILVLVDDMDLPLGTVRYRPSGGTAGHRGMESIVEAVGHQDLHRIRMGIGRPDGDEGGDRTFVLSGFSENSFPLVERMLDAAATLVESVVFEGRETPVTLKIKEEVKEEL